MTQTTREVLEFPDLAPYLLLKNGNFLYKVPFRGGWAVLKVYYGSRPLWETLAKSVGNVLFEDQTSYMPRTRLRNELECLELWARHGFRVFQAYPDVEVIAPGCPPGGYLLLEYVAATKMIDHLRDERLPAAERVATFRRFLPEWGRRHRLAVELREPRLVHENGDAKHVLLVDDGFMWFDFEMVFRSPDRVAEHVGHEIIQYLWHLLRNVPAGLHEPILTALAEDYPDRDRLLAATDVFLAPPRRLARIARAIDRRRRKGRKPTSKYNVARRLRRALGLEA